MKFGINYDFYHLYKINQRDILLVPFPFSDLSSFKQRPVLVVSKTRGNERAEDIIVCGITANLNNKDHSVLIRNKDLERGSLKVQSRIKVNKIFTLDKKIIRKRLGRLNQKRFNRVKSLFYKLF